MSIVRRSSAVAAVVTVVVVVAVVPACDLLFGIPCALDEDCPTELPFCVEGTCGDADDRRRAGGGNEGEGEGEGEGDCSSDADCPQGICSDGSDGVVAAGACLPAAGTEDCATLYDSALRDAAGPVIYNLSATASQNCFDLSFDVFDREGDAENGTVFYVDDFGDITVSASVTSTAFASFCLEQAGATVGLVLVDNGGNRSNTLCVHPAAPAP